MHVQQPRLRPTSFLRRKQYLGKNYSAASKPTTNSWPPIRSRSRVADVQYRRATCFYRPCTLRESVLLLEEIEEALPLYTVFSPMCRCGKVFSLYELGSLFAGRRQPERLSCGPQVRKFTPQARALLKLLSLVRFRRRGCLCPLRSLVADYPASRLYSYAAVCWFGSPEKQKAFRTF